MQSKVYPFESLTQIKQRLYDFADTFEWAQVLDSNLRHAALKLDVYELIAGIGMVNLLSGNAEQQLLQLNQSKHWHFFVLPYTLFEDKDVPIIFQAATVWRIEKQSNSLIIDNNGMSEQAFLALLAQWEDYVSVDLSLTLPKLPFTPNTNHEQYIKQVKAIQQNIYDGAYYELNYCIGFNAYTNHWPSLSLFKAFNALTQSPFAAWIKTPQLHVLCSSPERFLALQNQTLIAQPIKGTNRIEPDNDLQLQRLKQSEKDRAENVMIVDLMRNDLGQVSDAGTVKVQELCGAYAYTSVNHLVSSITAVKKTSALFSDVMQACFPMGSMTGAPKQEVMKHIQLYESSSRGYYSGSIGYCTPDGQFDSNVLIRSIVYTPGNHAVSYHVGGAIVLDSDPESEYQECLLKGEKMAKLFNA